MESLMQKLSLVLAAIASYGKTADARDSNPGPHKGPLIWGLYGENIGR